MDNKRKKIAVFGSCFTSRYRKNLSRSFNIAAEELNVDLYHFNFVGKIGNYNALYVDYESELLDYIDLSAFDGIVLDGEGFNIEGMAEKVIRKLRTAKCPVVSISSRVEGFYNIDFDGESGIRTIIEHFIDHHHFTKIGYMSGYLTHPDAQTRLEEFRAVMRERGLPLDGAGVFEGDFWFNKGSEAADYFLSLPERPEAIVCANDYMAISLCKALKQRGVKIPKDIAVSGFDGTVEGQEYVPHLTSVTRERLDIARKALQLLVGLADNESPESFDLHITPKIIIAQSCGCDVLDFQHESENINRIYELYRTFSFGIHDCEASMLKLNNVENVRMVEKIFAENSVNFGEYRAFFMMIHTDSCGRPAYDSDFTSPTGIFRPAVWIDRENDYTNSERRFSCSSLFPQPNSDRSHCYYIMCSHWAGRVFGYTVIEMVGKEIFNEFYIAWTLNLAQTLDILMKNDRINKLIGKLENLSIKDALTGMYNRRGFETRSRDMISSLREKTTVCTMVIDMDGLKRINDEQGHYEGDRAIKAAADIIMSCCNSGEIAGRAGGDEFYIFAAHYTESQLTHFIERMNKAIEKFNSEGGRRFKLEVSYGTNLSEADSQGDLEELLKVSDRRMYEQKQSKPGRRR